MNYRMIGYLLGLILGIEAVLLLFPLLVALIYAEPTLPFLLTALILALAAAVLILMRPKNPQPIKLKSRKKNMIKFVMR